MVKFELKHLDDLTEIRDELGGNLREKLELYCEMGTAYTIFDGGKPIAICGAVVQWEGVAEVWFLTTHHIDKCKIHFYREVMRGMRTIKKLFNLHRIQCSVEFDYEQSIKWLESMKFRCEGLMVAYGPDQKNHYRYSLTWLF